MYELHEHSLDNVIPGQTPLSLDLVDARRTKACPSCSTASAFDATTCAGCGVSFAKVKLAQQRAAQLKPRYGLATEAERRADAQIARGAARGPGEDAATGESGMLKTITMVALGVTALLVVASLAQHFG